MYIRIHDVHQHKGIHQDTGYILDYWICIRILDIHQDTWFTLGYRVYIRIQDIHKDKGYTSGYSIYIRIQGIHQDTEYTSGYRIYTRIQNIHQDTGSISEWIHTMGQYSIYLFMKYSSSLIYIFAIAAQTGNAVHFS